MRWTPGNRGNIEDHRGRSGMRRGAPLGIGGLLVVLLLSWVTGVDFLSLVGGGGGAPPSEYAGTSGTTVASPEEEKMVDMVDAVMEDAQSTWRELLGDRYQDTKAVLFRDAIQEGINAAAAIGDDRIQRQTTGPVSPDRFTHGSSEQRVEWFRRGFESGNPDACDTFQ